MEVCEQTGKKKKKTESNDLKEAEWYMREHRQVNELKNSPWREWGIQQIEII